MDVPQESLTGPGNSEVQASRLAPRRVEAFGWGGPPQFMDALFRDTFRSGWKFTLQLFAGGLMFVNIFHPTWNETLR